MKLVYLTETLSSNARYSPEQKEDIEGTFKALFSTFSACVAVKYVHNTPQLTHDKYIDEIRTRLISTIERVYECFSFLSYDDKESITEALRKDLDVIARDAKGNPKTFSYHY